MGMFVMDIWRSRSLKRISLWHCNPGVSGASPNPSGTSLGTRGWRMLEKYQRDGAAEMLNSQQGTETRFASQTLFASLHPGGNRATAAPGAEKGVGTSWWVTREELVGSGWWEMLWKIQ